MENNENQELPHITALENVLTVLDIPFTSLFWDENKIGKKKPPKYAVYYITNEADSLSSNDDAEIEEISITVSFYVKSKNFRQIKKFAKREFLAAGFFVSLGYETYETDTGYHHFDLNLIYYGG